MTSDRRDSRINELFGQARELGKEEQRQFLDAQCVTGEESVRQEVEQLLSAYRDAPTSDFKNPLLPSSSLARGFDAVFNDPYLDQTLGPYRLKKHIATGGFGVIYLAIREADFQQKVAVKILRSEQHDRDQLLRRFELERQLLADLRHEYIAHLISGGETPLGDPYFVMEYVEGKPITEYCDDNKLTIDQRLHLFDKVCTAVTHAHQYGVIHRDLKPSNILVNTSGVPKLLDFGIAKLFDPVLQKRMLSITQTEGLTPMTPLYASPEQVRSERVSTATDVYSLGVMLYELLTGRLPYHFKAHPHIDLKRIVCEEEPQRPSTVVLQPLRTVHGDRTEMISAGDLSKFRSTDPKRLGKALRGDLETILFKSLHKDRRHRYDSPAALAEDLANHLGGLPVRAQPPSVGYRLSKLVKKHRTAVVASIAIFLSLVLGMLGTTWYAVTAKTERERADQKTAEALKLKGLAEKEKEKADTATNVAVAANERLREALYRSQVHLAYQERLAGNLESSMQLLSDWAPSNGQSPEVGFEWQLLNYLNQKSVSQVVYLEEDVQAVSSHVRGQSIAILREGQIDSLDIETRQTTLLTKLPGSMVSGELFSMEFDDTGRILALAAYDAKRAQIHVMNLVDGGTRLISHNAPVTAIDFSNDGKWLATADSSGVVKVSSVSSGEVVFEAAAYENNSCDTIEFSPDGMRLATRTLELKEVVVWEFEGSSFHDATVRRIRCDNQIGGLQFMPDGNRLLVAGGRQVAVIGLDGNTILQASERSLLGMGCVGQSQNGDTIAVATAPSGIEVRDASTFELLRRFELNFGVDDVYFSGDDRRICAVSKKAVAFLEIAETSSKWVQRRVVEPGFSDVVDVAVDASALAYTAGGRVCVWNLQDGERKVMTSQQQLYCDVAFQSDSQHWLLGCTFGGDVLIWDLQSERLARPKLSISEKELTAIDVDPRGRRFVVGGRQHLSMWDLDSGNCLWSHDAGQRWCDVIEVFDDGKTMVTAGGLRSGFTEFSGPGYVRFWNLASAQPQLVSEITTPGHVASAAISPDRRLMAVGDVSNSITLINLTTMKKTERTLTHVAAVTSLTFHPKEPVLVAGAIGGSIKLWEVPSLVELGMLRPSFDTSALRLFYHPNNGLGLCSVGSMGVTASSASSEKNARVMWIHQRLCEPSQGTTARD